MTGDQAEPHRPIAEHEDMGVVAVAALAQGIAGPPPATSTLYLSASEIDRKARRMLELILSKAIDDCHFGFRNVGTVSKAWATPSPICTWPGQMGHRAALLRWDSCWRRRSACSEAHHTCYRAKRHSTSSLRIVARTP
jgi:hypothetical protein